MYVGIFGDVIFSVGHLRTLTLSNFKGSTGAEWVEHKVINGKAKPEYVGPKLKEYTCDILLDAAHGVNPRKMLKRLTQMAEDGEVHYFIIGFAPLSENRFRITDVSESWDAVMLALSEDSATQEEIQDVARCLRTLYSTPLGSQEGDRSLGIDQGVFLDKPIEVAKALYVREVTEKTAEFEPRARVVRVDWQESDVVRGEVIPKVVYELV